MKKYGQQADYIDYQRFNSSNKHKRLELLKAPLIQKSELNKNTAYETVFVTNLGFVLIVVRTTWLMQKTILNRYREIPVRSYAKHLSYIIITCTLHPVAFPSIFPLSLPAS